MKQTIAQATRLVRFNLLEYLRSGRIFFELVATVACYAALLRPTDTPMSADYLFTVVGLFGPLMAMITTGFMIGLVDRPQGYIVLAHNVSRSAYLLGVFFTSVTVATAMYGILSLLVAILNRAADLDLIGWILATLPLVLNMCLGSALILLLSPLVVPTGWRLFILALVAVALSGNVIGGPIINQITAINPTLVDVLRAVQTILSSPLVPAMYGYHLSITRTFSNITAWSNLLAQCSLLLAFLGLAHYAFKRRDLIFSAS